MMRTGIPSMLLGAALLTGLLTGCKQNEGERCQIDDDCNTDLICELIGPTRDVGGYCKSTLPMTVDLAMTPTTTPDMTAPPVDQSVTPPDMLGSD